MQINFDYVPLEHIYPFHHDSYFEKVLFGGFGSGKSRALCAEAIAFGLENPGARILMTRKTMPELRDTLEPVFFEVMPLQLAEACETKRIGGHFESVILPNGSTFLFRSIDDWHKHKSLNLAMIAWDELNEFDEETYLGMMGRLRQLDPTPEGKRHGASSITRRQMVAATNPSGHDWVWRRFVGPNRKEGTAYYTSSSLENPYLPLEYVDTLLSYPEAWVKRYVLCDFDDFSGQIYEGWTRKFVVPHETIEVPEGAEIWQAMDPGMRNPTASIWAWVDRSTGKVYVLAEYQETYTGVEKHAEAWRQIEKDNNFNVSWRVADPSVMKFSPDTGLQISELYRRQGFTFNLGPIRYEDRIPVLGSLINQERLYASDRCPMFFDQVQNYRWTDLTPAARAGKREAPETPVKKDEHLVDCGQYLASRLVVARPGKKQGVPLTDREQFSREANLVIQRNLNDKRMPYLNDDIIV